MRAIRQYQDHNPPPDPSEVNFFRMAAFAPAEAPHAVNVEDSTVTPMIPVSPNSTRSQAPTQYQAVARRSHHPLASNDPDLSSTRAPAPLRGTVRLWKGHKHYPEGSQQEVAELGWTRSTDGKYVERKKDFEWRFNQK